ncbi:MAG TPA: ATP-binding protein [Burkholderiales bacterium]|nr:ATP-binding protein [Burkholderiales bacterium]
MLRVIARSIRHKLALIVLATTLVALAVTGVALVIYDLRAYREAGFSDLVTQAEILGRASTAALAFDDVKAANEDLLLLKAKPGIASAAIYNARGGLFASYTRRELDTGFPRLPESEGMRIEGDHFVLFKRIVENNEILGTVYIKADYEAMARLKDYLGIFGAVSALSLIVALLVYVWLQNVLTRPILNVAEVTRRVVETRDFSLRARKTTQDEVGELADALNDMLAEIGRRSEALEQSNRFLEHEMAERQHADAELRKLNEELEQRVADRTRELTAANKEMEGFSYSVSHDLRTPLRAIDGYSRILQEDYAGKLDDEGRRLLGVIRDNSQKMGQLIDDLLAFARLGRKALAISEIDMKRMAEETLGEVTSGGQAPALMLGMLPPAHGDPSLVKQVWANLLANAVKFSSKREQPRLEVGGYSDGEHNVYCVKDNGAGFDMRYYAKLFGVFQRLHRFEEFSGTGVGLAIVQRVVVRHGGRVWAEGKVGEGAAFYFSLPKGRQPEETQNEQL